MCIRDRVSSVKDFPFVGKAFEVLKLDAQPDIVGTITGRADMIKIQGKSELKSVGLWGKSQDNVKMNFEFYKKLLRLDLDQYKRNSLNGFIEIGFKKWLLDYKWLLKFNQFDIRGFMPKKLVSQDNDRATLSGDWASKGTFKNWWASTGNISVSYTHLTLPTIYSV